MGYMESIEEKIDDAARDLEALVGLLVKANVIGRCQEMGCRRLVVKINGKPEYTNSDGEEICSGCEY